MRRTSGRQETMGSGSRHQGNGVRGGSARGPYALCSAAESTAGAAPPRTASNANNTRSAALSATMSPHHTLASGLVSVASVPASSHHRAIAGASLIHQLSAKLRVNGEAWRGIGGRSAVTANSASSSVVLSAPLMRNPSNPRTQRNRHCLIDASLASPLEHHYDSSRRLLLA